MTVERESFVLPAIFLTVALLGGLRIAETVRLMAPSLMAMVLAMLLMGCLARARALAPDRLMNAGRSALENVSGLVVLLTLFAACAQVFNLVTPETGLLFLLFSVFFLVQLRCASGYRCFRRWPCCSAPRSSSGSSVSRRCIRRTAAR